MCCKYSDEIFSCLSSARSLIWHPSQKMVVSLAVVAEWLRRWTRNPLGSARTGSNPVDCGVCFSLEKIFQI